MGVSSTPIHAIFLIVPKKNYKLRFYLNNSRHYVIFINSFNKRREEAHSLMQNSLNCEVCLSRHVTSISFFEHKFHIYGSQETNTICCWHLVTIILFYFFTKKYKFLFLIKYKINFVTKNSNAIMSFRLVRN
jgi:hypothetical protein